MVSQQCLLCGLYYHYAADKPVCKSCYQKFKWMEIYDLPNNLFEWGEEE